jgi:hypothetical protein
MSARTRLPQRRACETFDLEHAGLRYRPRVAALDLIGSTS